MPIRRFRPHPLLPGAHAQTLGGRALRALRPSGAGEYRRKRLATPDGDFLDLDVARAGGDAVEPHRPAVVVLHGLEGSSGSGYVRHTCRRLVERGLDAVALNFRSRGGTPNRARRFYHSGETGDLARVLRWLADRRPGAPIGAVGYSLGGNVLLKLLGEPARAAAARLVDAAVAVSVPFDLAASARAMERSPMGRLYARFFLSSLRRTVRRKVRRHGHEYDMERVRDARTLREFDDAFTAPVHGFEDAEDYYRESSSARFLSAVRTPSLLLHARDDPFLPAAAIPTDAARRSRWITPVITDRGGHLGFVERRPGLRPGLWPESVAARYLDRRLSTSGPDRGEAPGRRGRP